MLRIPKRYSHFLNLRPALSSWWDRWQGIQNEPNQPCESDCCGGDAKKPEHFGQHVRRSLSDRAKYSECGGYTGNQQQTVGRGSVAIWEVSYEPNYSGNRYPKIQARIVVEPIDKTSCVGINRAGTIGKSCERARSKSYQNSQDNFDGRVHHNRITCVRPERTVRDFGVARGAA